MSIFGEGSPSERSRDVEALCVSIPLHASPNNSTTCCAGHSTFKHLELFNKLSNIALISLSFTRARGTVQVF